MKKHFQQELDKIKKMVLSLGAIVEERVYMATKAVMEADAQVAQKVIDLDWEIDDREVELEEACLKLLALHQPVAVDLRFLIAVIKINNDLERIGDQAVNIAQRVLRTAREKQCDYMFDYSIMAEKAQRMLKQSLDSLVKEDIQLAFQVLFLDDEVDRIKSEAYDQIKEVMTKNSNHLGYLINLLLVSRHIERLADHTTNIAEEVIYLIDGEIVRHAKHDTGK